MWYLESIDTEEKVFVYEEFDAEKIKFDIFAHFANPDNREDELWFYKVDELFGTVGDTYIDTFLWRGNGVCKEVQKGSKTFYKKITL